MYQGVDPFFWVRDRKTVFIFDELVMRPFNIAKGPTFSFETLYNLLCIPLHNATLFVHRKKRKINTQNNAQNSKPEH